MRKVIALFLLCAMSVLSAKTVTVSTVKELYKALKGNDTDLQITLQPGVYELTPMAVTDSTLGNAENPDSMITVTTGLHLVGKNIQLIGKDRRNTVIKTHAGYGICIEHCPEVLIKDLTITGGERDQDPNATSGAIVVKHSHTEITGCIIENNQGDFSKTIAGIIGICGREGSDLDIHNNIIKDNSWDGIALYRNAKSGTYINHDKNQGIRDNLIYNGRGAGIGITWNAVAKVQRNVIHHYWKGIGTFGTSQATVSCNLVRDVRGWGIIGSGNSKLNCWYNEVRRVGNVGIAVWDSTVIIHDIFGNVIWQCGTEKQWVAPLVGIWINAPDSIKIYKNLFYDNKQADIAFGYKEPGIDGSDFSYERSTEKFNNTRLSSMWSLSKLNYYSKNLFEKAFYKALLSSTMSDENLNFSQLGFDLLQDSRGIFSGGDWSWDPDGEPFQD